MKAMSTWLIAVATGPTKNGGTTKGISASTPVRCIGDVVGRSAAELDQEGDETESPCGCCRSDDTTEKDTAGENNPQWKGNPEQDPKCPVQQVMPENRDRGRNDGDQHGDDDRVPAEDRLQSRFDDDHVHHIETDEGEQRSDKRQQYTAVAELCP